MAALSSPNLDRVSVTTTRAPAGERTDQLVHSLRDGQLRRALAGVQNQVGGETAMRIDATDALFANRPLAPAVMLLLVFLLLVVAMRSIVLPIKAIVFVVMSPGSEHPGTAAAVDQKVRIATDRDGATSGLPPDRLTRSLRSSSPWRPTTRNS